MTDNEIIKALEDTIYRIRNADTFIVPKEGIKNLCNGLEVVIDLINRLKADKEALIAGQESLMKCIAKKKETIAELDAEVERLRAECGKQSALWSKHFEDIFETTKETIKSEAIKEFAKEFVADLSHMITYDKDYIKAKIFKLVETKQKEMTKSKPDTSVSLIDGHIDGKEFWNDTH